MPKLPRALSFLGLWLGLCWPQIATVHAQSSPARSEPRAAPGASPGQDAPAYRSAVERAVAAYGAGDFEVARAQFERAHQAYPNARTLRGLGMAELELHDAAAASQHLEQALASQVLPLEGALREAAEASLQEARRQLAQASTAPVLGTTSPATAVSSPGGAAPDETATWPAPEPARELTAGAPLAPPASRDERGMSRFAPWLGVGLGAGAVVTGSVLLALAGKDKRDIEGAARGPDWADVEGRYDRYPRRVAGGAVLLGLGALGIAGGLTWRWASRGRRRDVQVALGDRAAHVFGTF